MKLNNQFVLNCFDLLIDECVRTKRDIKGFWSPWVDHKCGFVKIKLKNKLNGNYLLMVKNSSTNSEYPHLSIFFTFIGNDIKVNESHISFHSIEGDRYKPERFKFYSMKGFKNSIISSEKRENFADLTFFLSALTKTFFEDYSDSEVITRLKNMPTYEEFTKTLSFF